MAMNGRHLPPGQGMPPDGGRRRHYNQHPHQQQPHYAQTQQAPYNPYHMNPYNAPFYPQQQYHPQWNNQGLPPQYLPQYPSYDRTPPMHHYGIPPHHIPQQPPPQSFQRQHQSPAIVSTPYQPPSAPPPAPSSVHSQTSQSYPVPETPTTPAVATSVIETSSPKVEAVKPRPPFKVPLPWSSHPESEWPARRPRRKRPIPQPIEDAVELPNQFLVSTEDDEVDVNTSDSIVPRSETPTTSHPASEENVSTNPTTPSSQQVGTSIQGEITPTAPKTAQRPPIPIVPIVPLIPKGVTKDVKLEDSTITAINNQPDATAESNEDLVDGEKEESAPVVEAPKAWTKPKAWAGLFNKPGASSTASSESGRAGLAPVGQANAQSLAEALNTFNAESKEFKVSFIEPRGLVNTGNMCYMNSVLQVLVFCAPFYNFLDEVSKKAVHSFKSETPLIDAMIMFLREFQVIDSASSVEKLRLRLKDNELEQYGSAFTPDFVYEVINRLPRFSSMRRGHQQDAEEFLGFLLEGMHDESIKVIKSNASNNISASATPTLNGPASPASDSASLKGDATWQEVGPKQRAAVSRSVDQDGSPVTKIFGGKLRSEFRVPGLKDSVTYEPYQPLQLDIGAPNVNNIVDALKAMTRSETLHGDFRSPKGPNVTAVKQVFIEEVPPVLILHLKRFQYDNTGGTQKIWKKVGYPLELELPKEVFSRKKRNDLNLTNAFPKYRLTGVVYHHGKNASGGHYTVDVRRQDGREWIRLDDTVIRRIRSEDVAGAGSEEDPKVLAAALNAHKNDSSSANPFAAIDDEDNKDSEEEWKQANGPGKKWSSVVNGTSTPKPKAEKSSVKDNKVAYLLFYQKI